MQKLRFSGHESFVCKQLWPKKGFDFLNEGNKFADPDAIVKLGVGKNMVLSIRYWLKALGLIDEDDNSTAIARSILSNEGYDPYMEDIGTIWLFHYFLVTNEYASLYNIIFNDFLKLNFEFTNSTLHNHIKRIATDNNGNSYNEHTVNTDLNVFLRNYSISNRKAKITSFEDDNAGLFLDLEFIKRYDRTDVESKMTEYFVIERKERKSLPKEIFLFAVLDYLKDGNSISLSELVSGHNSVGNVFQLNREGVYQKIEELLKEYNYLQYTQTAGVPVLTFTDKPNPIDVLRSYYEGIHVHTIN